jgi:hypothetical protein
VRRAQAHHAPAHPLRRRADQAATRLRCCPPSKRRGS